MVHLSLYLCRSRRNVVEGPCRAMYLSAQKALQWSKTEARESPKERKNNTPRGGLIILTKEKNCVNGQTCWCCCCCVPVTYPIRGWGSLPPPAAEPNGPEAAEATPVWARPELRAVTVATPLFPDIALTISNLTHIHYHFFALLSLVITINFAAVLHLESVPPPPSPRRSHLTLAETPRLLDSRLKRKGGNKQFCYNSDQEWNRLFMPD